MTDEEQAARPTFYVGVDLGQARDYTAIAIIERNGSTRDSWQWTVRYLRRIIGVSYVKIVEEVAELVALPPLTLRSRLHSLRDEWRTISRPKLIVDATGCGAAVADLFRDRKGLSAEFTAVIIHGGDHETREGGVLRVPKRDLVAAIQVPLQNGRLKIVPTLSEAKTLQSELENFKVKISLATAHDSYGEWRAGKHDDLVLAVALAMHAAREWSGPCISEEVARIFSNPIGDMRERWKG